MAIFTKGVVPWNSLDDNTRLPTAGELEGGYPCGEADRALFNFTAGYAWGQAHNVIVSAGMTPDRSNLLQLASAIQTGRLNYAAAAGTANAIALTLTPPPDALSAGIVVNFVAANNNTSAVTLNVSALGAVALTAADGSSLVSGDIISGRAYTALYDGSAWRLVQPVSTVRTLSGNVIFYVRTDGNDGNDGGANSASRAFRTLAGAWDYIRSRYVGGGGTITLQLGNPGTYDGLTIGAYGGAVMIVGGGAATYVIQSPAGAPHVIASQAQSLTVSGVTLDYVYSGAAVPVEATLRASPGGTIFAQDIRYRCATNRPALSHNYVDFQSAIRLLGAIAVMGAGRFGRFVAVGNNGVFSGAAGGSPTTISTEGNVPVDDAWVWAHTGGIADFYNVIFSGAFATGKRYTAERGGGISVAGSGASFLPGTIAGTADAASGGWYA